MASLDEQCLALLSRDRWVGSIELAEQLEESWRSVAAAMTRLVKAGRAEQTIAEVPGTARTRETRRVFRLAISGGRIHRL